MEKMITYYIISSSPSADKLRAKAGRTMVVCAVARALANLAEEKEMRERSGGEV